MPIIGTLAMLTDYNEKGWDFLASNCDGRPCILLTDRSRDVPSFSQDQQASMVRAVEYLSSNPEAMTVRICGVGTIQLCEW